MISKLFIVYFSLLCLVVDMSEVNVCLQSMRANANQLLETISIVRPQVDSLIDEAAHVDVIEYVKGKMVEGVQLGITSKFSAPGKYRRNMKNLRKALASMDAVDEEVKQLLHDSSFGDPDEDRHSEYDNDEVGIRLPKVRADVSGDCDRDNESDIVPVAKGDDIPINDDLFSRLDHLDDGVGVVSDDEFAFQVMYTLCVVKLWKKAKLFLSSSQSVVVV